MLEKIFRTASLAVLSVVLISSTLFLGFNKADAMEKNPISPAEKSISLEADDPNPFGIVIESTDETLYKDKEKSIDEMSMKDIFGDEQIYPFEQGLGGHGGSTSK